MKITEETYDETLRDISQRQKQLLKRQLTFKSMMEDIMKHQKELEDQIERQNIQIDLLQKQNAKLKLKIAQNDDIKTIQTRKRNIRQRQKHDKTNILYNDDYYFNQFHFNPLRNDSFLQNFNEKRPLQIIELKKQREKYFNAIGDKKTIYHSQMFDYNKQQSKLICFQINSKNKDVTRYKFGLADQNLKEIKNASLSLYFQQIDEHQPLVIIFYVNLIKMKLYATSNTMIKSQNLPTNLKITKFTVFIYFSDIKTQITLDS